MIRTFATWDELITHIKARKTLYYRFPRCGLGVIADIKTSGVNKTTGKNKVHLSIRSTPNGGIFVPFLVFPKDWKDHSSNFVYWK